MNLDFRAFAPLALASAFTSLTLAATPGIPANVAAVAKSQINPRSLEAPIRFLADDALEGRGPATRGDALARLYLAAELQSLGYRCFWHLPPCVKVPNFRGNTENRFPGLVSCNMLCVPASGKIVVQGLREVRGPQDWWA